MAELTEHQSTDPPSTESTPQTQQQPAAQHTEPQQTVEQPVAPRPPRRQSKMWKWPAWTGFSAYTSPPHPEHTDFQRSKTFWDWLQLLIIPVILAAGALWFNYHQDQINMQTSKQQYQNDVNIAATRYANDQRLAADQQQETTLKSYLDDMSSLLLDKHLRSSKSDDEVRQIARAKTLTALQRLNPDRKSILVRFLSEANLIEGENVIIDLSGADLNNALVTPQQLAQASALEGAIMPDGKIHP